MPEVPNNVDLSCHVVHLLAFITKTANKTHLKVEYSAMVLVGGNKPLWALFDKNGSFVRFYLRRAEIMEDYPYLVWRQRAAKMSIREYLDQLPADRRRELRENLTATTGTGKEMLRPNRAAKQRAARVGRMLQQAALDAERRGG